MPDALHSVKGSAMKALHWLERYPRTAWYVCGLLLLNTILHIIEIAT